MRLSAPETPDGDRESIAEAGILDARGRVPYTNRGPSLYTSRLHFAPEDSECAFRCSISSPSITR